MALIQLQNMRTLGELTFLF